MGDGFESDSTLGPFPSLGSKNRSTGRLGVGEGILGVLFEDERKLRHRDRGARTSIEGRTIPGCRNAAERMGQTQNGRGGGGISPMRRAAGSKKWALERTVSSTNG